MYEIVGCWSQMMRVMSVWYCVSVCGVVIQVGVHVDVRLGILRDVWVRCLK